MRPLGCHRQGRAIRQRHLARRERTRDPRELARGRPGIGHVLGDVGLVDQADDAVAVGRTRPDGRDRQRRLRGRPAHSTRNAAIARDLGASNRGRAGGVIERMEQIERFGMGASSGWGRSPPPARSDATAVMEAKLTQRVRRRPSVRPASDSSAIDAVRIREALHREGRIDVAVEVAPGCCAQGVVAGRGRTPISVAVPQCRSAPKGPDERRGVRPTQHLPAARSRLSPAAVIAITPWEVLDVARVNGTTAVPSPSGVARGSFRAVGR